MIHGEIGPARPIPVEHRGKATLGGAQVGRDQRRLLGCQHLEDESGGPEARHRQRLIFMVARIVVHLAQDHHIGRRQTRQLGRFDPVGQPRPGDDGQPGREEEAPFHRRK